MTKRKEKDLRDLEIQTSSRLTELQLQRKKEWQDMERKERDKIEQLKTELTTLDAEYRARHLKIQSAENTLSSIEQQGSTRLSDMQREYQATASSVTNLQVQQTEAAIQLRQVNDAIMEAESRLRAAEEKIANTHAAAACSQARDPGHDQDPQPPAHGILISEPMDTILEDYQNSSQSRQPPPMVQQRDRGQVSTDEEAAIVEQLRAEGAQPHIEANRRLQEEIQEKQAQITTQSAALQTQAAISEYLTQELDNLRHKANKALSTQKEALQELELQHQAALQRQQEAYNTCLKQAEKRAENYINSVKKKFKNDKTAMQQHHDEQLQLLQQAASKQKDRNMEQMPSPTPYQENHGAANEVLQQITEVDRKIATLNPNEELMSKYAKFKDILNIQKDANNALCIDLKEIIIGDTSHVAMRRATYTILDNQKKLYQAVQSQIRAENPTIWGLAQKLKVEKTPQQYVLPAIRGIKRGTDSEESHEETPSKRQNQTPSPHTVQLRTRAQKEKQAKINQLLENLQSDEELHVKMK